MMPLRPRNGFGDPGSGASPKVFRSGDAGPARLRKASATTCGDDHRREHEQEGRRSLERHVGRSDAKSHGGPERQREHARCGRRFQLPRVARTTVRPPMISTARSGENTPPGNKAAAPRRAAGRTSRTRTTRSAKARRPPISAREPKAAPSPSSHWPKISANAALFFVSSSKRLGGVECQDLDPLAARISGRHRHRRMRGDIALLQGEFLALLGEEEVDEGLRGVGVLGALQDGDRLRHGRHAFLREHELDRRALGLLADGHEIDDHAVELLAARDALQDVAVAAARHGAVLLQFS